MTQHHHPKRQLPIRGCRGVFAHGLQSLFSRYGRHGQPSFENMLAAVTDGQAKYAMVPVENSVAGRVADIHHLLPSSGLFIVGEHFQRVNHHCLV